MQSRMDKYETYNRKKFERSKKNTQLYENVYDDIYRDTTYKNMEVIDSAKEINLNKLKNILDDKYDTRQYRTLRNYSANDVEQINNYDLPRSRVHDINEIINQAKSKRAFIEEAKEKQKFIEFTNTRNKKYNEIVKEEQELEDLISTMTLPDKEETDSALDLFSELKGSDNTMVVDPIETSFDTMERTKTDDIRNDLQKTLVKADKNFYTDSNMFTKNDFEDFADLKGKNKKGKKLKIFLIILFLIISLVLGYFIYMKYFIK